MNNLMQKIIEGARSTTCPALIMGILNVTPDSFYDGGKYLEPEEAIARGLDMVQQGADIVDVGGESTRPGAKPVPPEVQIKRILPAIRALADKVAVSVDTRSAKVAEAALNAGAIMVNDVSGFTWDQDMLSILKEKKPLAVVMHMRGTPEDMMLQTHYRNLIGEVISEIMFRVERILRVGMPVEHVFVDPGIGFSKTWKQNLHLINNLDKLASFGFPVVVGVSRKSFIGQVLGQQDPNQRLFGTAAAVALAVAKGARVLRVHDVSEMKDVARIAHAICSTTAEETC